MKIVVQCSVVALSLLVIGACDRRSRDRDRPSQLLEERSSSNAEELTGGVTLTGASWVANESAIDRIVAARCAREISCNNVGLSGAFATGDVCAMEVRKQTQADLKGSECPGGIDGKELDGCLDAIRHETCSNPIDAMSRLAACRTGELCLKAEMPHR